MERGPCGAVRAAVLLICAVVLAAPVVHGLEHVPAAGMGDRAALMAHSPAASAACGERATATMLQSEL